jgi:putative Mg2+ transporter-C (MgtC) family protein
MERKAGRHPDAGSNFCWVSHVLNNFTGGDPSRIAAGVVTGIGFLGAGAILHRHGGVEGLTTAATIWVAAGIGLAAGAGLYILAPVVTILVFIILILPHKEIR